MPAFAETQAGDRTAGGIPGAVERDQGQVLLDKRDRLGWHLRPERLEPAVVKVDASSKVAIGAADQGDAGIEELAPLEIRSSASVLPSARWISN